MANITELRWTVSLMLSDDWKERFVAEYRQLKIRYKSLEKMLEAWEKNQLDFTPNCPKVLIVDQLEFMKRYLNVLEIRADVEGIDLEI